MKIEKTEYAGWPSGYRISNREVEVIVTSDIGPRIIRPMTTLAPGETVSHTERRNAHRGATFAQWADELDRVVAPPVRP